MPRTLRVLLVGPDGSGKTSTAVALDGALSAAGWIVVRRHWAPGWLPRPGRLLGRPMRAIDRPHDPHRHGPVVSALVTVWFLADFVVGDVVDRWHARRDRCPRVIVQERGWWDLAVDPRRYRVRTRERLVIGLGRLVRNPHLTVVLAADPKVVGERSAELSEAEVIRQTSHWNEIAPTLGPVVRLDTSASTPETVADEIIARLPGESKQGWRSVPFAGRASVSYRPSGAAPSQAVLLDHPCTPRARHRRRLIGAFVASPLRRLGRRVSSPPQHLVRAVDDDDAIDLVARPRGGGGMIVASTDGERLVRIAKYDEAGESVKIARASSLLVDSALFAPTVLAVPDARVLCLEAESHQAHSDPLVCPPQVADALGAMWRRSGTGYSHGDFAPWNLLDATRGPVLIDWEHAFDGGPAFYDLWHWFVQGHLLLGGPHPTRLEHDDSFRAAFEAFSHGAELDSVEPNHYLASYLRVSAERFPVSGRAAGRRRALLGVSA